MGRDDEWGQGERILLAKKLSTAPGAMNVHRRRLPRSVDCGTSGRDDARDLQWQVRCPNGWPVRRIERIARHDHGVRRDQGLLVGEKRSVSG